MKNDRYVLIKFYIKVEPTNSNQIKYSPFLSINNASKQKYGLNIQIKNNTFFDLYFNEQFIIELTFTNWHKMYIMVLDHSIIVSINDKSFLVHTHDNLYDDISKFRILKINSKYCTFKNIQLYTNEKNNKYIEQFQSNYLKKLSSSTNKPDKKEADKNEADKKEAGKKEADKKEADKKEADKKEADKKKADKKEAVKKGVDKKIKTNFSLEIDFDSIFNSILGLTKKSPNQNDQSNNTKQMLPSNIAQQATPSKPTPSKPTPRELSQSMVLNNKINNEEDEMSSEYQLTKQLDKLDMDKLDSDLLNDIYTTSPEIIDNLNMEYIDKLLLDNSTNNKHIEKNQSDDIKITDNVKVTTKNDYSDSSYVKKTKTTIYDFINGIKSKFSDNFKQELKIIFLSILIFLVIIMIIVLFSYFFGTSGSSSSTTSGSTSSVTTSKPSSSLPIAPPSKPSSAPLSTASSTKPTKPVKSR